MAIFNRDGKNSSIKEYITATDTVSRPMAILLTAIIFVLAAAVAFTLFWAGKWTYNRLTKDNSGTITQTSSQKTGTPSNPPAASTKPSATPTPTGTQGQQPGGSSGSIPSAPASGEVPNTGPNEIPNTGPQPE